MANSNASVSFAKERSVVRCTPVGFYADPARRMGLTCGFPKDGGMMPTGENRGKGFGWGAYRTKMGKIIVARSNTPRSVSMTPANSDYYDSLDKGHKSAMVNRAMDNYRGDGFTTHELLANIEGLQQVIAELLDDNPPGPVAPKSVSLMGGLRAIVARMWPF